MLDPDADRASFQSAAQIQFLRARATAAHDAAACIRSQVKRDACAEAKTLLAKSKFSAAEIDEALSQVRHSGDIVLAGDFVADASYWHDLVNRAGSLIDQAHEQNPERRGVSLSELRTELEIQLDKFFNGIISELTRNGFARYENQIGRVGHHPSLPPQLLSAAENIRAAFSARPFDPPDRKAFSQSGHPQQALRFLMDEGEIVEIAPCQNVSVGAALVGYEGRAGDIADSGKPALKEVQ